MRYVLLAIFSGLILVVSLSASAGHDPSKKLLADGNLVVTRAWARATPPGTKIGAAYLTINNIGSNDDAITGITSNVSEGAMLHATVVENGVMRMYQVDRLEIPAGGSAILSPGGLHTMLMGLKSPLKDGDTIDVTVSFDQNPPMTISVPVLKNAPKIDSN